MEREVQTPSGVNKALDRAIIPSPEEIAEFKAKAASILDRGIVHDRLKVELPDHLIGQWEFNSSESIAEAQYKGWEIDTEYAAKSAIHGDGSGRGILGDCVHMVMPRWKHEVLEEAEREKTERSRGRGGIQKEEEEYLNQNSYHGVKNVVSSKIIQEEYSTQKEIG